MAMPIKKPSSGRNFVKTGAPAPGAARTPPQDQKGMNGSNAAPPNKGGGMAANSKLPEKKPSVGRSASMPKHAPMKGGKEAPPASSGGKVGPSRAGESAQPLTAAVAPDVSGGAPSGAAGATDDGAALLQQLLSQAGHTQQPGAGMPELPPEIMAALAAAMQSGAAPSMPQAAPNPKLQSQTADTGLADLIRRMMLETGQMQNPQQLMSQVRV